MPGYSLPPLDVVRCWIMQHTGYPLPSLFLGPFPRQLTTHIYEPVLPVNYTSEEDFIKAYYDCVTENYSKLCLK